MEKEEYLLVICIDRDNDLGKKANVEGPIIGRNNCINAAVQLALKDPTDSDTNSIFGAVKKFDEVKKYAAAEVVVLTGYGKTGFESDYKIMQQLTIVLEKFPITGFVLVTDGAEDDQVIPLLQGRAPIISKETIIVKQASEVESTYYTIKQALKDPDFARTFILVPGLIVLLWGILAVFNSEKLFFQSMLLVVGSYLILKGTGLEEKIAQTISTVTKSMSLQRVSFPFYLMTILLFFIGAWATIVEFNSIEKTLFLRSSSAIGQVLLFLTLSSISFLVGKSVDAIQLKKAYYLRKYFVSGAAVFIIWFILDASRQVIVGEPYADLTWFGINVLLSFVFALITYKISQTLDLSKKITNLLIGLPVYNKTGKWIGLVETIIRKESITYKHKKTNKLIKLKKGQFLFSEGKVQVN